MNALTLISAKDKAHEQMLDMLSGRDDYNSGVMVCHDWRAVLYRKRKRQFYALSAALERKLAAAERRIEYLEADLKLAQQQVAESEERREFAARLEFG